MDEVQPGNFWFGPGIDDFIIRLQHQVTREISEYRQFGLANPHRHGSRFWANLPFSISDDMFLTICPKSRSLFSNNQEKHCFYTVL